MNSFNSSGVFCSHSPETCVTLTLELCVHAIGPLPVHGEAPPLTGVGVVQRPHDP